MGYADMNAFAARICGIKPVNTPPKPPDGDTEDIVFQGIELTVELDADGTIEGITSANGSDVYCCFQDWAIDDIEEIVEKSRKQGQWDAQYEKGADRAERMAA